MLAFKLEENLSPQMKAPLLLAGYDVHTVAEQSLHGAKDAHLAEVCRRERRCLITADEDFGEIVSYPPQQYVGVVILRDSRPSLTRLDRLLRQMLRMLETDSPSGRPWIVEPGRVRIYDPDA